VLAVFGEKFELVEFSWWPDAIQPGGEFYIHLPWRANAPDDARYTVFVHLATAETPVWAGADAEPCQAWRSGGSRIGRSWGVWRFGRLGGV
jgi:hypothetical protein